MAYHSARQIRKVRNCVLLLLVLQFVLLIERIIIDGFGRIYLLIILNFITILFVICAVVGLLKYQVKLLFSYIVWLFLWIGLNVFVIILYLNVGVLSHEDNWLSLHYEEESWFKKNGIGCRVNDTAPVYSGMRITNCVVRFEHMEVVQASLHIVISLINFFMSCWLVRKFKGDGDDEDSFGFVGGFDPLSARVAPARSSHPKIKYIQGDGYEI